MDTTSINNLNDADIEYKIIVKGKDDILSELTSNNKERFIYESIIDNIEKSAADNIKAGKIVQLPAIGCVRKNPTHEIIKKNYDNFRVAKKNMTSEQYKQHVKEIIIHSKQKQEKLNRDKYNVRKIRSRNKEKYDKLYINLGKAYAEMYIYSLLCLREVPFDIEFQQHYDNLNNR